MAKPDTREGYTEEYTADCERVLVTLLRGLGPWKDSVFLVGGLVPRYLILARPPAVPAHAGTLNVDVVIDLQILADTEAYHALEDNLRNMGFERAEIAWRSRICRSMASPMRSRSLPARRPLRYSSGDLTLNRRRASFSCR